MERLHFGSDYPYNGLEAAVHLARYSFAKAICTGKRVLDIACGEGYGSHLMSIWGASAVQGVDISAESVAAAQQNFALSNLRFTQGDAASAATLFSDQKFDLIVSLETIEHVAEPEQFLASIKTLLAPGGCIVISCPNDWWYYPTDDVRNPYHLRKYHLSDFQRQTESVLGNAIGWFFGGPLAGFCNLPLDRYSEADAQSNQMLMLESRDAVSAQVVPAEFQAGPRPENASYFIGVWSDQGSDLLTQLGGAALLPLSMDAFRNGIFQGHWPDDSGQSERRRQSRAEDIASLIDEQDGQDPGLRHAMLRRKASEMELDICRAALLDQRNKHDAEVQRLQADTQRMTADLQRLAADLQRVTADLARSEQTVHDLYLDAHRFRRVKSLIPGPLWNLLRRLSRLSK